MSKETIKTLVWGLVVGAIGLLIVIFATGWVVTSSSAQGTGEERAICVAQFQQDPNREERLKELKETGYGKRDDYVDERGWATMSGDESPDRQVADECARQLFFMKLDQ
jgi:hypothetical protein